MKQNIEVIDTYQKGFKIDELFKESIEGIKSPGKMEELQFYKSPSHNFKFGYKIFDDRYLDFDLVKALVNEDNAPLIERNCHSGLFLIVTDQIICADFHHLFLSKELIDDHFFSTRESAFLFPLYIYREGVARIPNFKPEVVRQIAANLYLTFTPERESMQEGEVCFANSRNVRPEFRLTFSPLDLLDYMYAVLHSASYRRTFKGLLKSDFPRVPYPADSTNFWALADLGGQLRKIHLLESPALEKVLAQFPVTGDNKITNVSFSSHENIDKVPDENGQIAFPDYMGTVHINDSQYFTEIPLSAWEFYMGDYQPAQNWLELRKGQIMNTEDIFHFQKIIHSLIETQRVMQEIDKFPMH